MQSNFSAMGHVQVFSFIDRAVFVLVGDMKVEQLICMLLVILFALIFIQQAYSSYVNWKNEFYPLIAEDSRTLCMDKLNDIWHKQQTKLDSKVFDVDGNSNELYPAGKAPTHFLLDKQNAKYLRLFNKNAPTSSDNDDKEENTMFKHAQKQLRLVTSPMTLRQYIEFFFTLRLEHAYDKTIQFFCYLWYKLKGDLDFTPSDEDAQTAFVKMVWNTSVLTGYEGKEYDKNGNECFVFRFRDYEALHGDGKTYKLNLIEIYVPIESMVFETQDVHKGDLLKAKCDIFVDGEKETVENMYAVIHFGVLSTWIHPRVHALAAWISMYKMRGGIFEKMHMYTTAMNDCSSFPAVSLDNVTCPAVKRSLTNAIDKGMWKHNQLARDLSKTNRLVHFVHQSRKVIKNLLRDMDIDINPEVFMAGSVLHSLDHILMYKNASYTRLLKSDKYGIDARLFAFLFIGCTRGYIVDTRMSNQKEPFIQEIYMHLTHIDKEYADLSHYCISW